MAPPAGTFTQVSAGGDYSCGVKADGSLACWGYNDYGEVTPAAGTSPRSPLATSTVVA